MFSSKSFLKTSINFVIQISSCPSDYIKIDDTTGSYITCGTDRPSYDNKLCSSVVYVSYLASTANVLLAKGFKIYYECKRNERKASLFLLKYFIISFKVADRTTQPDCPTGTVAPPTVPSGSLTTTTTPVPLINNFVASAILTLRVCRGNIGTINSPPANYFNFITETFLGVPQSLTCEDYRFKFKNFKELNKNSNVKQNSTKIAHFIARDHMTIHFVQQQDHVTYLYFLIYQLVTVQAKRQIICTFNIVKYQVIQF